MASATYRSGVEGLIERVTDRNNVEDIVKTTTIEPVKGKGGERWGGVGRGREGRDGEGRGGNDVGGAGEVSSNVDVTNMKKTQ